MSAMTPAKAPSADRPSSGPTATLWRCGGRTCPPGTCDHEDEVHRDAASSHPAGGPATTASTAPSTGAATAPGIVHDVLRSSGSPLPDGVRRDMEHRLGHDFASVRIHRDAQSARSAESVQARAYTVGRHVVFGQGAYAPESSDGRRVLLHELVHTMQQPDSLGVARSGLRVSSPHDQSEREAEAIAERASRGPVRVETGSTTTEPGAQRIAAASTDPVTDDEVTTLSLGSAAAGSATLRPATVSRATLRASATAPMVQRDFALAPPRPRAVARALTAAQMASAIAFNERVVTVIGLDGVRKLRDVLGVAKEPAVIDEEFVNAVVRWQAVNAQTQDGRLGPTSAAALFREIGAESAGHGEIDTGPRYTPSGTITPPVVGGNQSAPFRFTATFKNDPANGIFASCCEVRQFIRWDAASAAALAGGIPHAGFPAGTAAGTWIEDRDGADTLRYGHRAGRHGNAVVGNEYTDTTGHRNQAFGHIYRGRDFPGGPAAVLAGRWTFMVQVIDVCHGGRSLGQDFVRINW